jgi:8-oxo-dGTP diphosphatase
MPGKKNFCYEYPRPAVTVDLVVLSGKDKPRVLLIRRKNEPFAGMWAIPGGFVDMDESLEDAARRELHEETGATVGRIEQLHTFGDPKRDPRGRTISVVYLARVNASKVHPKGGDDAAEAAWHSLDRPPQLAFDHAKILACVRRRLRKR